MGRRAHHAAPRLKVVSNTAISLDGRINTREGGFPTLGTAHDHARMSRLRAQADAVLVGGATFRNWPHPALPDGADRAALAGRRPWTVVVSRTMNVPVTPAFLAEPGFRPLFLTRAAAVPRGFAAAIEGYDGRGDDLPVAWMLDRLRQRGVQRLLIEAGGDLLFQFLAADAIDEMHVTLCPLAIGGPAPSLLGGAGFDLATMRRLQLLASEVEGDEIFLHYAVTKRA
jgi:riboflavin biosynthesis pyrimidine reductase